MKTFKEFQDILEEYRDPKPEKIEKKVEKVYHDARKAQQRNFKAGKDSGDILHRASRRIAAMHAVHSEFDKDPNLYAFHRMMKIPTIDYKRKRVEEEYQEPNTERMKRKLGNLQYATDLEKDLSLDSLRTPIYKGKPPMKAGYPKRNIYFRNDEGKPTRNVRSGDLESVNRLEKHLKNRSGKSRRIQNISAKLQQYERDPLSYMSRSFGGPHADDGMQMRRKPLKRK